MKLTIKHWSLYWAMRLTKWKGFGLGVSLSKITPSSVIGWDFAVRYKTDHPGIVTSLDLLWFHFEFEFIDSRHWSPSMKRLAAPEDADAGIRDFSPSYEPSEVIELLYEEFGRKNIFSIGMGEWGDILVYLLNNNPDLEDLKNRIPSKFYGWEIKVSSIDPPGGLEEGDRDV